MATVHLLPNTTSSATFFRAIAIASSARTCPHHLKTIPYTFVRQQSSKSSKRELYTVPSYQPHSLPNEFQMPPRNAGVPDTSIAGSKPEINTHRPYSFPVEKKSSPQAGIPETASIGLPEREAQKSKPVADTQTTTTKPSKPRRTKLRPRKAAMTISAPALEHLRNLLDQPNPKMIRVGVKNRGCSGLAYHLEYVEKPGAFDEIVEQEGVKVLIDSKALFSIIGSEMDWKEDKLSARFVFRNPNITEECGCGESFSIS